jgi:hypothetical protein
VAKVESAFAAIGAESTIPIAAPAPKSLFIDYFPRDWSWIGRGKTPIIPSGGLIGRSAHTQIEHMRAPARNLYNKRPWWRRIWST